MRRAGNSTPAAPDDPTDPFVTAQATALQNDPNQIYAFVRDQIKFEAYAGSVRGARGALWAMAGNTLDKASLLTALLQASGYTTQYAHIYLEQTQAGDTAEYSLLRSMFPTANVLLGCIPSGTADDPAYDGFGEGDTNDYYWVQYGPGLVDLDPNLPNGTPGQSLAQTTGQTPDTTFTTIPANLRQQVTIKVNAEQYSQASGLFGFGPSQTTVLQQSFDASALVGNIVSVGNIVQGTATGGLDLTATTFTYTPYLLIGSGGPDVSADTIVTGTDYQEFFTNFPLSSTILTGLFVEVDADDSWYYQQHPYTHTMFDRLGPAARQGNASVSLNLPASPTPAVSNFDIASFNILTTHQLLSTFQAQQTRLNNAYQAYEAIKPAFEALPTTGALSAAQQATAQQAATLAKYLAIAEDELVAMSYNGAEDQLIPQLQNGYFVHVYPNTPRITVGGSSMGPSGNAIYSLDVLKNDMRTINGQYQNRSAKYYEEVARGMITSIIEASVLSGVTGQSAIDIGTVMATLGDPNQLIGLGPSPNYIQPPDASALSATTLSADAQTLILNAVQNGFPSGDQVITPNQMVTINGVTTVGWWETDSFGHTVSHFPNGYHQAIVDYAAVNAFAIAYNKPIVQMIGNVEGAGLVGYAFAAGVLEGISTSTSFTGILKAGKVAGAGVDNGSLGGDLGDFFENLNKILKQLGLPEADELGTSLIGEFDSGLENGIKRMQELLILLLGHDPEIFDFLTIPPGAPPAGVTPGAIPGVTINITTDPLYTMPFNGNELPVYDATIVNTGPATDTFRISSYDTAGQFSTGASVPALTLLPGQAGKINLCAVPYGAAGVSVAPVGSTSTLNLILTSATSNAQTTASTNYVVPAIPSLSLTVDPLVLTVAPGGTVAATVTLTSVGNANPGSVALTSVAQTGIAMNGLTSPVTIPASGALAVPVTFTAAANATNNTYYVTVTATYTTAAGVQNVNFSVPVTVQLLGTCSLTASLTANQTGASTLGITLASLANDMNSAAAAPSNAAYLSRIAGDLAVVNNAITNISYLQAFAASITAAGSAVASATPATLLAALTSLDATICPVGTALSQASSYNTQISMSPNSLVTGPNLPAVFSLRLYNPSNTPKVYNLSVTGVPSGVTSQFSTSSVTLGPYPDFSDYSTSITLTLTPGASFTAPFTFNVVATPVGAPEFAIAAPGTLLVRPQAISIDNVTATPSYGPAGTQFVITARVFSEVNQDAQGYLQMQPYNSSGSAVTFGYTSPVFNLTTTSTLQTVTIATIDSTTFANGVYTLNVTGVSGGIPIPGAAATGSILVGAPLSGTLTANANSTPPGTVPPGNSSVQVALNISRDTTPNPVSTLVGTVGLSGVVRSMTLYQNGNQQLAYVASDSIVNIVDVTDPTNLKVVGTFAGDILTTENGVPGDPSSGVVPGFQVVTCAILNHNLILSFDRFDGNTTASPIPTHFATYSLANPLSPVLVGSVVDIARSDSAGLYVAGNTALMYQSTTFYNQFSNFIFQETGDIWAADLTNAGTNGTVNYLNDVYSCGGINPSTNACNNVTNVPNATYVGGVCTPNGTTPIANDPTRGGPYRIGLGTAVNGTTSYFASTNAYGGDIENPSCPQISGQLLVVDTTTPASPAILTSVSAPAMTFMTGVAVQGNIAVAVGDSTGIYDINSGYVGTLVISSFDITNPTNPVLLNSVTTQLTDKPGSFIVALGQNTFAVGNTSLNNKAELVLVDATNPNALRYVPYDATFVANPAIAENGFFFALSSTPASTTNSISAFQLTQIVGPQLTVKLQLPTTNCQNTSFSLTPNSCTPGAASDTYEFDQPTPNLITFNVNLTGVNPGDVDTVVTGGEMDYTLPSLGSGKIPLGPLTVLSQQILSISPDGQIIQNAGNAATYSVTVSNPTATVQTFVPSTLGIPASWGVQLPASVTVAAGSSQSFNLVLTSPLNAVPTTYKFFAVVQTAGGISASVGDSLTIYYAPNSTSGNVATNYVAFTGSITPSTVTVGQNGSASFQVQITNTGSGASYLSVGYASGYTAPSGWQINWTPTYSPLVQPGLGNTATITGILSLPPVFYNSTAPGTYTIPLQVQYYGQAPVNIPLTVNVIGSGVTAQIQPGSGSPQANFNLYLNNVGNTADTYNLTVQGPLQQVVTVQSPLGPIGAGRSTQVPININPVNYLAPGNYTLQIAVVSQTNSAIQAIATATVTVSGTKSVSAAITPSPASVPATPGSVALLFQTNNTGNLPDTYKATITGTTGPVTATLNNSGQTVAFYPVPALGNSEFPLNAQITGSGKATITVAVTSLSDNTITSQATVTINNATPPPPVPTVNPSLANVTVHRLADLDASGSTDPSSLPLTFTWTVLSVPPGSAINSGSINLATSAIAAVRPDVLGTYVFNVHVSNGTSSADTTVTYTAVDALPIADPGHSFNTAVGGFTFLHGTYSYDPDGQPITFGWTLISKPLGSNVTSASISNSQTPSPFFISDLAGPYQFQLVVTDASASSLPATVTVTAYSAIVPPNADAGRDQNAALHAPVTVNGNASADVNSLPLALNYLWSFATVPAGSTASLSNANNVSAQFTPDLAGDYVLNLVVSNAHGASQTASVTIHTFTGDIPPNANAGASQFVLPNGAVDLNSQSSADPDSGPLNLTFLWWLNSLPASSTAALQNPLTATPTFVADKSGYYIARVEATDGLKSGFANTLITSAVTCDADANGVINQTDIAIIQAAIGQSALANDPRDFNHDGQITSADVTGCSNLIIVVTPTLQISPSSFSETLIQGSPAVKQTLQVSSSGNPISFTVTSNQSWLTASISSGSTSSVSSMTAQVDPTGLTPATYQGMLTFTPTSGAVETVSVTLTVIGTGPITASPSPLTFTASYLGVSPPAQGVTVTAVSGTVSYTVASDSPWLATTSPGGVTPSQFNVYVTPGSMAANTYNGNITVTSGAYQVKIPVTLTIVQGQTTTPIYINTSVSGCTATTTVSYSLSSTGQPITYTAQSDSPWLTPTSAAGTAPSGSTLTANINPIGLVPGSYVGLITVSQSGTTALLVQVKLTVGTNNLLTVLPPFLVFTAPAGTAAAPQSLSLTSACGTVSFGIQVDQPWLSTTGQPGQTPAQSSVTADATKLAVGTSKGNVTVTAVNVTNSPLVVPVTFIVTAGTVPPPPPPAPTAVVTPTQANVPVHRLAELNASGSTDPGNLPLTFTWTLSSAPSGSALTSASINLATSAIASFRPDVLGAYVFNVLVSNGSTSSNATVTYTAIDAPPVAIPGNPFNTAVGGFTYLNGVRSYDPDGQPITFAWTLASKPPNSNLTSASLNNAQTPQPFFTPDVAGSYALQLIVTDAGASSSPATVIVTAYSATIPPNANAGSDQNARLNTAVVLNGGGSVDPNKPPLPLAYQWTLRSVPPGSSATLTSDDTVTAMLSPDKAGDYLMGLVVSNANGLSQTAFVTVHAFSGDVPPNAVSGAGQFVLPNATVSLSAQGSTDPDSGPLPLNYLWWLDSLAPSSTATLQNPLTVAPQFVADKTGFYIGRVEANDGLLASFSNTLIVSAATCDVMATGTLNATDVALIQAALGQSVLANDPRDFNHDGMITEADVAGCAALVPGLPVLQISPSTWTLSAIQGSSPVTNAILVSSSGSPIHFTVSSNQGWLTPGIGSGNTSSVSRVNAQVNPNGLTPGVYSGILSFTPDIGVVQTVTVTLTVSGIGPVSAAPSSLTFTAVYGAGNPPPQTSYVTAVNGTVSFTLTSSQPWLTVQVAGGITPLQLSIGAAPGNMAPGTYNGIVTLTSGTYTSQIAVTLSIIPLAVTANPAALQFNSSSCNGVSSSQVLQLSSNGAAQPYSVSSNVPWLTVSPSQGTTGAVPQVVVTFNSTLVPAGTTPSGGVLTVSSPGLASFTVPVTVAYTSGNSLGFNTGGLTFTAVHGSNPLPQTITANSACGSLTVQIYGDSPWISVNQLQANTPAQAVVSINTTNLAPGTYTGNVIAYTFGSAVTPAQATVTLVIQ